MRTLLPNIRVLILVVLVVCGALAAGQAALWSFGPEWQIRWALPVVLVITLEAILSQRIVVAERQTWADQWRLRLFEAVMLAVLVRGWVMAADGRPLRAQIEPWLRDPLSFFSIPFICYGLVAAATWGLATWLSGQVLLWSAAPGGGAAVERGTILRGHLDVEASEVVARFDRVLLAVGALALGAALIAVRGATPGWALLATVPGQAVIGALAVVGGGLLLHSTARLQQLHTGWRSDGAAVDQRIPRQWSRASTLLLVVLALLGPALGALARVAPPPPLIPVANALLWLLSLLSTLFLFIIGLILLPFAWPISLLRGTSAPAAPALPPIAPPQLADPGSATRPLVPALVFWGCVVLLIVVAALRYIEQRPALRALLRRWPLLRWLLAWLESWWADAQRWSGLVSAAVRRRLRRPPAAPRRRPRATGARARMRQLYRRMLQAGAARGVPRPPAVTPFEYSATLGATIPPAAPDVAALTAAYVAAEYGPDDPDGATLQRGQQLWRRLQRWLGGRAARLRRR